MKKLLQNKKTSQTDKKNNELSEIFKQFPHFQKWAEDKKLNSKDLTILTEFKNINSIKTLIQWIENRCPTHSEGVQILEIGGELILMNQPINSILSKESTSSSLIASLKKLRWVESSLRDEKKSKIVSQLSHSNSLKTNWVRQGDRGALSIQFKSFSMRDLKQKIQQICSIYKQLDEGKEKLWRE